VLNNCSKQGDQEFSNLVSLMKGIFVRAEKADVLVLASPAVFSFFFAIHLTYFSIKKYLQCWGYFSRCFIKASEFYYRCFQL